MVEDTFLMVPGRIEGLRMNVKVKECLNDEILTLREAGLNTMSNMLEEKSVADWKCCQKKLCANTVQAS